MSTAQAPAQAAIIPFMRGVLPIAAAGADYRGVLRSCPKRRWLGSARSVLPLLRFSVAKRRNIGHDRRGRYGTVIRLHCQYRGPPVSDCRTNIYENRPPASCRTLAPDWAPADAVNLNCRQGSLSYPSGFARNLLESTEQIELQKEA